MPYTSSPSTVPRDVVYMLLGLTQPTQSLLTDVEVDYFISKNSGNTTQAAVEAARVVLFKLSQNVRSRWDNAEVYEDQLFKQWSEALQVFVERNDEGSLSASLSIAVSKANGYAGNISLADMQANDENVDNNTIVKQRDYEYGSPSSDNPFLV